ncbi:MULTISPECIES: hypothetical protein [Sphingobium]|uniref:Uncharacterized protein n=1 Tax=Sphingobium indicum (strain DSM 16413 / CCM 7287 / MTCC 6362 / UT26 / NBRC 101211 / UT26S) TaxID=452662 RepID=D4Z8W9_SPHIU|nr:hypothetical protein [Sphingobium indicum]BAI99051.1 hypothetical protein SJA_P1-00990 [Sphingobium indicum UT26S]
MAQSRTYKLRLSKEGIDLFLQCHCRLAHLLQNFIPYGVTLMVAVAILEGQDACDVVAELEEQRLHHCIGDNIRFVGSSTALIDATKRVSDKLLNRHECPSAPQMGHLYIIALLSLASAEDRQLVEAFERVAPPRRRSRQG